MSEDTVLNLSTLLSGRLIPQLINAAIYFAGIVAILLFLYDNFKSVISIIRAILEPYFIPQTATSLADKYGKWAVITGCTDGIGKEYARELAKQGINIVLISRTEEKLVIVANELQTEFKVKTKWIAADFAKGREVYAHIKKELAGIPVGILVNNVGKMYDFPSELDNIEEDTIWDMIYLNVAAVTLMSRMIIPHMKEQGKGAIVNLSSGSELQPVPLMAIYAATKRYVRWLTLALQCEVADYNITVQCITPLFLVTKMNQYSKTVMKGGFLIPTCDSFTRSAVYTLGKTTETTGYWTHGLQYFLMKLCPIGLRIRIAQILTRKLQQEYLLTSGKNL